MKIKILIFSIITMATLSAQTICTPENISAHPYLQSTCQMYENVESMQIEYNEPPSHLDYETQESHKMFLQGSKFTTITMAELKNHFGIYEKIKNITVENTEGKEKTYLKILAKPIEGQEDALYCNEGFDLFTVFKYTDKNGLKNESITFLKRNQDVYGQLEKMVGSLNKKTNMDIQITSVDQNFDLYCGKLKTNTKATFDINSQECSAAKNYESDNATSQSRNEIAAGDISIDKIYIGNNSEPKKVCTINYKKELYYQSNCYLTMQDLILEPGENQEEKLMQIRSKYTAPVCCGRYPNAFVSIENPFDILNTLATNTPLNELIKENFDRLNLSNKIMCTINTKSAGYKTIIPITKEVEPSIKNPISLGCGGITYTGAYEQNVIDRLNNFKHVISEATKPYTKCCDEDSMSEIQKIGQVYSLTMCYDELAQMITTGTFGGQKISKSMEEINQVCSKHFAPPETKAGSITNSKLQNVGLRTTQTFTSVPNYLGCLGEEIGDLEIVKKVRTCYDENYKQFMDFINWLVSQQLTIDIGLQRLRSGICQSQLDNSSTIDLSINLNDYVPGLAQTEAEPEPPMADEGPETLRIEEGKNYYGVIKRGNQYIPALTLQDQYAFERTNSSMPFMGKNSKEEPTFLYSEINRLFEMEFNSVNENSFESDFIGCKKGVVSNIEKVIEDKMGNINALKTIDGYVLMYADNGKLLNTGKIADIGFFEGLNCSVQEKEDLLKKVNKALSNYIIAYLKNKPKTLKEAELGLIKMDLVVEGGGNYVDPSNPTSEVADQLKEGDVPKYTDFASKEEYVSTLKNFRQAMTNEIVEQNKTFNKINEELRSECMRLQGSEKSECMDSKNIARDDVKDRIKIIKGKLIATHRALQKHDTNPTQSLGQANSQADMSKSVEMLMGHALNFKGIKYVWGSKDPIKGLDCSGFVGVVARDALGVKELMWQRARDQIKYEGRSYKYNNFSDVKRGDFLYFWATNSAKEQAVTHTGISMGGNNMIHAKYDKEVRTQKLGPWWTNHYTQPNGHFYKGMRLLTTGNEPVNSMVQHYPTSQYNSVPLSERTYDKEEYERVLKKYEKEELDTGNPMYLKKKSLEVYQSMKRNNEIDYYKNVDLLKKSIGAF